MAEESVLQSSSSRRRTATADWRFTTFDEELNENSYMVKNHSVRASYDPNNPTLKLDFNQFCTYCKTKFGPTFNFYRVHKTKKWLNKINSSNKTVQFQNCPGLQYGPID